MFELLASLAFVTRHGDELVWTDEIAPAMQEMYCWTEDGEDQGDIWERTVEEAWETMPEPVRRRFVESTAGGAPSIDGFWALLRFVSLRWRGGRWQDAEPEPAAGEYKHIGSDAMDLTMRLQKRFLQEPPPKAEDGSNS